MADIKTADAAEEAKIWTFSENLHWCAVACSCYDLYWCCCCNSIYVYINVAVPEANIINFVAVAEVHIYIFVDVTEANI